VVIIPNAYQEEVQYVWSSLWFLRKMFFCVFRVFFQWILFYWADSVGAGTGEWRHQPSSSWGPWLGGLLISSTWRLVYLCTLNWEKSNGILSHFKRALIWYAWRLCSSNTSGDTFFGKELCLEYWADSAGDTDPVQRLHEAHDCIKSVHFFTALNHVYFNVSSNYVLHM